MVGEIRDLDTANAAINAALTGHLVFATIHTNSALEAIERLINLGVKPYLLAASIQIIIGQRLVRKLNEKAKNTEMSENDKLVSHNDELIEELEYVRKHYPEYIP